MPIQSSNPHARKFMRGAEKTIARYESSSKTTNSKTSGIRAKVADWKKKVSRAGVDFGRKVSKVWNRKPGKGSYSKKKQYVSPGLRDENRKFAERWVKGG